jgi:hypothetical protein
MPYFSVSLTTANSTTPGNSAACALPWLSGKPTSISLSFGGSSTVSNDATVQFTLDDIMRVASTSVVWQYLSSGVTNNSTTAYHFASTTWYDTGFLAQVLTPLAAVRLGSSALSSTGGLGSITLKVLQGEVG